MDPQFHLSPEANTDHTQMVGTIEVAPASLVRRFGAPMSGEGYKVSGEFAFTDVNGNVFTVYDWKATSLYYEDENDRLSSTRPTPEEFWTSSIPSTLNVGGHRGKGNVEEFKQWLISSLR